MNLIYMDLCILYPYILHYLYFSLCYQIIFDSSSLAVAWFSMSMWLHTDFDLRKQRSTDFKLAIARSCNLYQWVDYDA